MSKLYRTSILVFLFGVFALNGSVAVADEHGHEDEHEHPSGIVELDWSSATKAGVIIVLAAPGTIKNSLSLNAEVALNGDTIVHVSPRFPGVVKRVEKNLGDSVKAGELLAVIQSNESLTTYEIRAEVNGTIIEKDATRGEFVRDDKVLFVIADLTSVWINAAVYPENLKDVSVGREVIISSRSVEGSTRSFISYLRPSLSELTRTALIRMVLPNTDRKWLPGMFVRADVLFDPVPVPLVVPTSAVKRIANEYVVFVKANGPDGDEGFQRREVEAGASDGEFTEILSGLKPGEEVAAGNTFILKAELGKGSAAHEH